MARKQQEGEVRAKDLDESDTSNDEEAPVDDYPERPYAEALTDEHRKVLEEAHQLPPGA